MIVELQDNTRIDLNNYGVKRLFHYIPSLSLSHRTQTIEGRGDMVVSSEYKQRNIRATLLFIVENIYKYYALRDELNALFARNEAFYITFKREQWKRYKVRLASQLNVDPAIHMNSFDVDFLMDEKYAESTDTSLDLQKNGAQSNLLQGLGITTNTAYNYTFNTANFVVKNIGNALVDPREAQLDITIKGVFQSQVKMTNQTTGDVFIFTGALTANDTLKLTGVRTLKNNVSALKSTNKKLITLNPGENNFLIEGGTVTSIVFDFRFLYM